MNEHPLHAFLELIQFDRQIQAIQESLAAVQDDVARIRTRELTAQEELEQARAAILALRKEVSAQELDMAALDTQEKEKKYRLEKVTSYKEYQLLQQEVTALQHNQIAMEQTLLAMWNRLELAERMLGKKEQEFVHTQKLLQQELHDKQQQVATLEQELAVYEQERLSKQARVPEEWREKYAAMRARVPDPVVEALSTGCSACFSVLPEQDLLRLRRGALIQCKHCFRFLYTPAMMASHKPA